MPIPGFMRIGGGDSSFALACEPIEHVEDGRGEVLQLAPRLLTLGVSGAGQVEVDNSVARLSVLRHPSIVPRRPRRGETPIYASSS